MPKIPNPFDKPKGKAATAKYFGYGHKRPLYGKKNLGAGVDTRPTERDSQIRKSNYGSPRTARDIELDSKMPKRPRPMPKNPRGDGLKPRPMPMPRGPRKRIKPRPMPKGKP